MPKFMGEADEYAISRERAEQPPLSSIDRYMQSSVEVSVAEAIQSIDLSPSAPKVIEAVSTLKTIMGGDANGAYTTSSGAVYYNGYVLAFDGGVRYPTLLCYKANTVDYVNNQLPVQFTGERHESIAEAAKVAQLVYYTKSRLNASDLAKMMLCNNALTSEHDAEARAEIVETAKALYPAIALRAVSYRSSPSSPPRNSKEFFMQVAKLSIAMLEKEDANADLSEVVKYIFENGDERLLTQIAYYMGQELASETPSAAVLSYLTDEFCSMMHNVGGVVPDTCGSDLKPSFVIGLSWSEEDQTIVNNTLMSFVDLRERKELAEKLGFTAKLQAGINDKVEPRDVLEVCIPGMYVTTLGESIKNEWLFPIAPSARYSPDFAMDYSDISIRYKKTKYLMDNARRPQFYGGIAGFITEEGLQKIKEREAEYLEELKVTVSVESLTEQEVALMQKLGAELNTDNTDSAQAIGSALHIASVGKAIRTTPYTLIRANGVSAILAVVNGKYLGIAAEGDALFTDQKELLAKFGLPKAAEAYLKEGD